MSSHALVLLAEQTHSVAVFYYDYLLTLADEIRLVWQRPFRMASFLYIIIRYGTILTTVLNIVTQIPPGYGSGFGMTEAR